jgi:hypothetical protein
MPDQTILWRRLDRPGHETARLSRRGAEWILTGAAVFAHAGQPCRLDYRIACDERWQTRAASVAGWVGERTVEIQLAVDGARRWQFNGEQRPQAAGCLDLDLNFSPATNLLPIRRLGLAVGAAAPVRAAWLRFPGFSLEPLEQVYSRISAGVYRYESAGGAFVTELAVDAMGFVTDYPNFWTVEAAAGC